MNIHDYLEGCLRTWEGGERLVRAILGLVGEAGEVAEKYKKYLRDDYENEIKVAMALHGEPMDESAQVLLAHKAFLEAIKKELGDVIYYWAVLCYELGLDPAEVMEDNLKKLADRQERGKIKGSGDER